MSDRRHDSSTTHLSEQTWEQLACDELSGSEAEAARAHIAGCEDCAVTWAALTEMRAAAEEFDPALQQPVPEAWRQTPKPAHPVQHPAFRALLAAAMVVAVAGIGLWQRQLVSPTAAVSPQGTPPTSNERADTALRPVPTSPAEGTVANVTAFSWQGAPTADRYSVELLGSDGALLWQSSEIDGLQTAWPTQVERAPGTYYWRVVTIDGGQRIASDLVRFELAP